jgi:hypothetical protein
MRMLRGRLCRCGRMDMPRQLGQAGQIGGCPGGQDQVDGTGTAADLDVDVAAVQDRLAEVEMRGSLRTPVAAARDRAASATQAVVSAVGANARSSIIVGADGYRAVYS